MQSLRPCYAPPAPFQSSVLRGPFAPGQGLSSESQVASEREVIDMQLITVRIDKPEATNFILGQTHFIKTVEDVHEALVSAVPGIRFGLAFCEASGKCLVRWSGTDSRNSHARTLWHSLRATRSLCFWAMVFTQSTS